MLNRALVSARLRLIGCIVTILFLSGALGFGLHARAQDGAPPDDHTPPHPLPKAKDLVALFSGKPEDIADNWTTRNGGEARWPINPDGSMTSRGGDIMTKKRFKDYQLHVEFKVPYMPDKRGQARGNSGVFQHGRYEIQVLDSYGIPDPGTGDCGAIYNEYAPLVNACKPPLQWQTYDIVVRAPRADSSGQVKEQARITVIQNGIVVQNNREVTGVTGGAIDKNVLDPGPILLQDHGNPMQYRNIWILPLPETGALHYQSPTVGAGH